MEQALAGKELARPYIGIRYTTITRQMADTDKLPVNEGALVGGNQDGSGGRRARHARPPRRASRTATSSRRSTTRRSMATIRSTPC